jgi:rhamnosyltransferase
LEKIIALIITYEPEMLALAKSVICLSKQVDGLLIVDNGSRGDVGILLSEKNAKNVEIIKLKDNYGIGYAQNRGVKYAKSKQATHVLLMDQDSMPADNMVYELLYPLKGLPNAAAVGPVYVSEYQNESSLFTKVEGFRRAKVPCDANHPVVKTDALIASGCLIPMSVLDVVGEMREDLFIDYVDTEWGLRAQAMGYESYAVWSAKMSHQLGSRAMEFMGRNMIVHSPLRRYYQYRNAILLYKMKHIPLNWKLIDASRLFLRAGFYALTNQPRVLNVKMMLKGLWHGILGKTGKMP